MQKILSINTSIQPAEALLVGVSEKGVEILEQHQLALGDIFSIEDDHSADSLDEAEELSRQPVARSAEETENATESHPLQELIAMISDEWSSSILIVPSENYLSLTLPLPFVDSKSIDKVIDLEVQDLIPFDVNEFLLDHCLLQAQNGNGMNDVHVGLIPKEYVKNIVRICKANSFEPVAITSPASALAAFYYAAPDYFAKDSAIVYFDESTCYSCVAFDGIVRSDRSFHSNWLLGFAAEHNSQEAQLKELRVALASLENRYTKNVEKIYLLGSAESASTVQNILGRSVELLSPGDITRRASSAGASVAAGASIFVKDVNAPRLLSNFRTREYAFRPQLKQLFSGLRLLSPYLLGTLFLIVAAFLTNVLMTAYQIRTIESTIAEQIENVAPGVASEGITTVARLKQEVGSVEGQLNSLGAPSRFDPLSIFNQLARDIAKAPSVTIRNIRITGARVTLSGTAPSYADSDELKRIFKRNKEMYCSVDRNNGAGSGGARGFEYIIDLCN